MTSRGRNHTAVRSDASKQLLQRFVLRIAELIEHDPHFGVNALQLVKAELMYLGSAKVARRMVSQDVAVVIAALRILSDTDRAGCRRD